MAGTLETIGDLLPNIKILALVILTRMKEQRELLFQPGTEVPGSEGSNQIPAPHLCVWADAHCHLGSRAFARESWDPPLFLLVSVKQVSTKYKDKEWTLHLEPQYQTRYPAV